MSLQNFIQNLPEKLQQAEWLAQGYAHGKHATLADIGCRIQAILDSNQSPRQALQDLAMYCFPPHKKETNNMETPNKNAAGCNRTAFLNTQPKYNAWASPRQDQKWDRFKISYLRQRIRKVFLKDQDIGM